MLKLPRNAQIWLPGYLRSLCKNPRPIKRVYVMIGDHFEPLRGGASDTTGRERVGKWTEAWPQIAGRHRDSAGSRPVYTFFYPEEEYRPYLIEPLALMTHAGIGDVEVHVHHDGEGEQDFRDRMTRFIGLLHGTHGLLRETDGQIRFGFIHGNWALDNSLPGGRWCGLNNELTILSELGCYADFTLPSAPSPSQTKTVNQIYWAIDDPARAKSHDRGRPVTSLPAKGHLLMIQGPLALNWKDRSRAVMPKLEVGELAGHNPVTRHRVCLWLDFAPRVGDNVFVKLFAHGAWEKNTDALLEGDLDHAFEWLAEECAARSAELRFVSAWGMYREVMRAAGLCADQGNPGVAA